MIRRAIAATLAAAAMLASQVPAAAQNFPARPSLGAPRPFSVPASETYRLPNGMQVTLIPYGITPRAVVSLRIRAGGLNQGENVWLANMTAQMLREGSLGRTGAQIAEAAASMGGNLGIGSDRHETSLNLGVLSEHTADAVRLIADVARRPTFPAAELERVRAGMLRNLAVAKSQPQPLAEAALASAYYGTSHPYGRIYPTEAQLKGYTAEQVRTFHERNFGAQRARLYIAGRFDAAAVRAAVQQAYGDWEQGPAPLKLPPTPKQGPQVLLVDRPGAQQSTIRLAFAAPRAGADEDLRHRVMESLLSGAFNSRVTTNIREAKGYTYSPGSGTTFNAGEALWSLNADVTTDVTGPALKEIFYEIRRLQTEAPATAEAAGIQTYRTGTFVLANASAEGLIGTLATRDLHGLPANWLESYIPSVLAITPAQIQAAAREGIPLEKMTLVVVGDIAKITPQLKALPELKGAKFETVRPFG